MKSLNPKQLEILRRLTMGESRKEVADNMKVSVGDIDYQWNRIQAIGGFNGIVAAVKYAIRNEIIEI